MESAAVPELRIDSYPLNWGDMVSALPATPRASAGGENLKDISGSVDTNRRELAAHSAGGVTNVSWGTGGV
jgi:hypothetical protein